MNRVRSTVSLSVGSGGGTVSAQDGSVSISTLLPVQPSIILDVGTSTIKIGVAGESVVRCVISTPIGLQYLLLNPKNPAGLDIQQEVTKAVEVISGRLCAPALCPVLSAPISGTGSTGITSHASSSLLRRQSTRHGMAGSSRGFGLGTRTNSLSRINQSLLAPPSYNGNSKPPRVVLLTNANANLTVRRLLVAEIKRRVGVPVSAPKESDEAPTVAPGSPRERRASSTERNENTPMEEADSQLAQRPIQSVCAQISALAAFGPGFRLVADGTVSGSRGSCKGHISSLCGLVIDAGYSSTRVVPVVHQSIATGGELMNVVNSSNTSSSIGSHFSCVGVAGHSSMKMIVDSLREQIIRDNAAQIAKNRIPEAQLRPAAPNVVISSSSACLLSDELLQDVILQYGVIAPPPGHPSRETVLNSTYPVVVKTFFVSASPNIAIEKSLFFPCLFAIEKWAKTARVAPVTALTIEGAPPKLVPLTHEEEIELLTLPALSPGDEAMPVPEAIRDWWLSKEQSPTARSTWLPSLSRYSSITRATLQSLAACHPWLELPMITGNFRGTLPVDNNKVAASREGGAPLVLCGAGSHIPFFTERVMVSLTAACHRTLSETSTHWAGRNAATVTADSSPSSPLPFFIRCDISYGSSNPTSVRGWNQCSISTINQVWPNNNKLSPTQVDTWYAMGQLLATSFLYMQVMGGASMSTGRRGGGGVDDDDEEEDANKALHTILKKVSTNPHCLGAMALFAA